MAFNRNPQQNTYDSNRISFVGDLQQRNGVDLTKDYRLVNMMVELHDSPTQETKKAYIKSRPGMIAAYTVNVGVARGMYYWTVAGVGYAISVVAEKIYVNGVYLSSVTTTTGPVGFTEFVSSLGAVSLVLVDGTNGYIFSSPLLAPVSIAPVSWTLSTVYTLTTKVSPTVSTGYYYTVTTAGTSGLTEPAWISNRLPMTAYALSDKKGPTVPNGFYYDCTTAGTTGAIEPVWPVVLGGTVTDGTVVWTCIAGTITDGTVVWSYSMGDFPVPHLPDPIFMDGYLFLAKDGTQDIYNSNLDDPTMWTAGDFLSAEMYPDTIKALTKNNNYVYAVGSNSVEYFFDAANATGSPLQRHDAAVQQFGTVAGNTVVQTEKEVILIGATGNGGNTVWTIDGFKEKEIGTPAIKHALLAEGTNLQNATAYAIRVSGQKLYVLILTSRTLVYSFDTKLWHEWASGVNAELPFKGQYASDGLDGSAYILDKAGTTIYKMNASLFKDNLTTFRCEVTTSKFDVDTMNRKFISRTAIVGDIPDGGGTENAFYLDWSDDDYNTWSTPRVLNYTNDFPMITQLGAFRRRAFRLRYSLPHLVRLEGLELDYNKGQQ